MPLWNKRTLRSLVLPGGAILLGMLLFGYFNWLSLPAPALNFLSYCGLLGGMLLAWRFHSSRVFFCLLVLLLLHQGSAVAGLGQHAANPAATMFFRTVSLLVPINYALISLMEERGLTLASATPVVVFLFVESVVVSVLCRGAGGVPGAVSHSRHANIALVLPNYSLFAFGAAAAVLGARFLYTRKTVDSSLLWSLLSVFLSFRAVGAPNSSEVYVAGAAAILAVSIIENSYLLAYHDELTLLPSRRAFNDATLRLQEPYSLAVVDIDHFKRFNDTYGHDTGDDVLRMVAARLAGVTGGGQAYRCGGEEFTILFPGKVISQVVEHLERLRLDVEIAEFRMRGNERRQVPRGPDRRNEAAPAKRKKKADAIRQLSKRPVGALSVTISIGVATSETDGSNPDVVVKAADKALYRAKEGGRNRVEVASPKRRSKAKAAGIA